MELQKCLICGLVLTYQAESQDFQSRIHGDKLGK